MAEFTTVETNSLDANSMDTVQRAITHMSNTITKPLLAGRAPSDLADVRYPVYGTAKLDGVRSLLLNGTLVSRTFKQIPNNHIRRTIEAAGLPDGLDGELMVRGREFNDASGDIRRSDGRPDFYYAVFDYVAEDLSRPYTLRMNDLRELSVPAFIEKVLPEHLADESELLRFETQCLASGYEGAMIRDPAGPYKLGRSSTREGYLLKIKRFEDSEALVYGVEEMMHNDNVAGKDAFGRTERSTHKENMRPAGTMGKLLCRLPSGVTFEVGTGYTAAMRQDFWNRRKELIGKTVKFKFQPSGAKEGGKPRFPVFLAFRDSFDL